MNLSQPAVGFLGVSPAALDAVKTDGFAVIGAPYGNPYTMQGLGYGATQAPTAIRNASARHNIFGGRYDFDLEGPFFDPNKINLVDLGDCVGSPTTLDLHLQQITNTVRHVAKVGATPIVLGGDDSTPIPVCAGLDVYSDIHVLQIDAHLDYRDEVNGHRQGYSSPMRRIREMSHFAKIVHVGARGMGSAYAQDFEDTLAAGNEIFTARQIAKTGIEQAFAAFPDGANVYISIDCDGFDPSVMPGTSVPLPGGLQFYDGVDLIHDLVKRCNIVGLGFAEHYPEFDVHRITSVGITRLICNLIGTTLSTRNGKKGI